MKRILAAVDVSENSDQVLARAVELARPIGAKVRLVHAVPIPTPISHPGLSLPIPTDVLLTSAEAATGALMERIPEELRDGSVVAFGTPVDVVCNAASEYDAEFVVIGAHRYGVLSRVLGTTAARIVNKIDRPVLVVRPMPSIVSGRRRAEETPSAVVDDAVREPETSPGQLLRADHDQLEGVFANLLDAYRGGDWADVRRQWDLFDVALRAHMETEEKDVFPSFRAVDAKTTRELLSEHQDLRKNLDAFGVRVDLHALSSSDAENLIGRVRAHAAREEHLLYPWVDRALPTAAIHGLLPAA